MSVKELREMTGMSQKTFAMKYHIPLQTLKQWESKEGSKSHRNPPDYVEFLLGEVVRASAIGTYREETEHKQGKELTNGQTVSAKVIYTIRTAKDSRDNARLWLRYIAKHFEANATPLNPSELQCLLACDDLTMFQKCALKSAYQNGSPTNQYVIQQSQRCDTSFVENLFKRSMENAK